MAAQEVRQKDFINTVLENEKRNRRQISKDHQQLCNKVFQNIKSKSGTSLFDQGTITESSRWYWQSYPV